MFTDVLILAGGAGERLWPASHKDRPKQFMRLFDGISFFEAAILRALSLRISGKVIVITRKEWINDVITEITELEHIDDIRKKIVIIGEPCGKNTAPASALASRYLLSQDISSSAGPCNMLVLPSDHIIKKENQFIADMEIMSQESLQRKIALNGIKPQSPETGFGYIEIPEKGSGEKTEKIISFREKPDLETAVSYVSQGNYWWNSGIYAFMPELFLEELAAHAPLVYKPFAAIQGAFDTVQIEGFSVIKDSPAIETAYTASPSISLDYAVSEKSRAMVMVKASFSWDDAGTWDALSKYKELSHGLLAETDAHNNFVFSDIPTALCGASDLIVVIKNGKALILKKGMGSEVKKNVDAENRTSYPK